MKIMLALVAALALPSLALADDMKNKTGDTTTKPDTNDKSAKLEDSDVQLVSHMHHVNQSEIDLGKLAAARGSASVRKYGQELMKDHSAADKELTAFAKKHGVAKIPAYQPDTEAQQQEQKETKAKVAELKKLKGAEFDRQFLNMAENGHAEVIANLDSKMSGIKNPDLAAMLKDQRPVLQRHLDAARDLQKSAPTASVDKKPAADKK